MGQSIALPFRFVVSGRNKAGNRVQYISGDKPENLSVALMRGMRRLDAGGMPEAGAKWSHIYVLCGLQPLSATTWAFAEPTLPVPFGWDVVYGGPPPQGAAPGAGRSDLAGVDARPAAYLFHGPDGTPAPETSAPSLAERTLAALKDALRPEAVIAVAIPTVIGLYAAKLATRR
jgi:hypothetical protein